jgi:tetratricopeptide (TPR) repeat protein
MSLSRCLTVSALLAALGFALGVAARADRVTIYQVAETPLAMMGTEFGQTFRAPCDGSLVSVTIADRNKRRRTDPVRVRLSILDGDHFAGRIGAELTATIDGEHPVVTAEWAPGAVPLRAGWTYYLQLVGDHTWYPVIDKKHWKGKPDRQPYALGCLFAEDELVITPRPANDLAASIVAESAFGVRGHLPADPAEALLERGLDNVLAGETRAGGLALMALVREHPDSPQARVAMRHLLDEWGAAGDFDEAWAGWRMAMLGAHPLPPPADGDREVALSYLRMGYVLAGRGAGEDRLADCFVRAMIWGDASLLPLEAAEAARMCCQKDVAEASLRATGERQSGAIEPWMLFLEAVFMRHGETSSEAYATLVRLREEHPDAVVAAPALVLLSTLQPRELRGLLAAAHRLFLEGKREESMSVLEKVLERYPYANEVYGIHLSLGWDLRAKGLYCEAAPWFEKAAEEATTSSLGADHVATAASCWEQCGNSERALEALRTGLVRYPDQASRLRTSIAALEETTTGEGSANGPAARRG